MSDIPPGLASEIETLREKHERQPEGRFFVPLANAYRKAGQVDEAVELLEHGLEIHPDYLSAYIVLGRCLLDREELGTAEVQFRRVLEKDPQNLVALRFLGEIGLRDGRPRDAAHWYRELVAVDPMNDEARAALASIESGEAAEGSPDAQAPADAATGEEDVPDADEIDSLELEGFEDAGEDEAAWATDFPAVEGLDTVSEDDEEGTLDDLDSAFADSVELDDDWGGDLDGLDLTGSSELEDTTSSEPAPATPEDEGQWEAQGGMGEEGAAVPADRSMPWIDEESDAPGEAADEADDDVVTETMARLYTEQGLYAEAAHVYRRLLEQRGEDPRLREQLEAVLHSASEEAEDTAIAADRQGGDREAQDATEAWEDPFDASFEHGFAGSASPSGADVGRTAEEEAPPTAVPETETPEDASATIEQSMEAGAGDTAPLAGLEPIGSEEFTEQFAATAAEPEERPDGATIGSFLDSLLRWSAGAPSDAGPDPSADAPDEAEPWMDESPDTPADTERTETAPPAAEAAGTESVEAAQDFSYESFFEEDDEAANEDEQSDDLPEAVPAEPADTTHRSASETPRSAADEETSEESGEDDDDLESFQSWLKSLKR